MIHNRQVAAKTPYLVHPAYSKRTANSKNLADSIIMPKLYFRSIFRSRRTTVSGQSIPLPG